MFVGLERSMAPTYKVGLAPSERLQPLPPPFLLPLSSKTICDTTESVPQCSSMYCCSMLMRRDALIVVSLTRWVGRVAPPASALVGDHPPKEKDRMMICIFFDIARRRHFAIFLRSLGCHVGFNDAGSSPAASLGRPQYPPGNHQARNCYSTMRAQSRGLRSTSLFPLFVSARCSPKGQSGRVQG